MKKSLLVILSSLLLFGFYSCSTSNVKEDNAMVETNKEKPSLGGSLQIPNPYYTFDTLEEAAKIAGFSITLPDEKDLPDWIIRTDYRATKSNLMEIIYPGDEEYKREIRLRKAITDKEDMSGDYNSYEKESKIAIGDKEVTIRMNGNLIYGAIWRNNEFAYSVHISDGMKEDDLKRLISFIN